MNFVVILFTSQPEIHSYSQSHYSVRYIQEKQEKKEKKERELLLHEIFYSDAQMIRLASGLLLCSIIQKMSFLYYSILIF